jgi:SAM-dependent methyltransferase
VAGARYAPPTSSPALPPRNEWDDHWEAFAGSGSLNPAQGFRRRLVLSLLVLGRGPVRVLEIGSGQGDLSAELAARYPRAELRGIDYSRTGIEIASRKVPGATFIRHDLAGAAAPPARLIGWATHAVCSEVLEHVDDPARLLRTIGRCLAPGGRLVVTVPGGPMSAFDRHIGHRRHFTAPDLERLLAGAGYEVARVVATGFPFFNLYRLVVIARGRRLATDVAAREGAPASPAARAAMAVFRGLLAVTVPGARGGWEIAGVAQAPGRPHR